MAAADRPGPPTATSEDTADAGCIFVSGPHREYTLAEAHAWREGDVFVLRGTEFAVMAEDEDFEMAVAIFIGRLLDYAIMLYELVEAGDATEGELEVFQTLSRRLTPLAQTEQQDTKRRRRPPRRRGAGSGHWRHRGTQASGSVSLSGA